jgi:hypothetical protein
VTFGNCEYCLDLTILNFIHLLLAFLSFLTDLVSLDFSGQFNVLLRFTMPFDIGGELFIIVSG